MTEQLTLYSNQDYGIGIGIRKKKNIYIYIWLINFGAFSAGV